MPLIYAGHCTSCDAKFEYVSDGYRALYLDEPSAEAAEPSSLAHPDDPHLVILAHPCEETILESHGYRWAQAAWQGRLVHVQHVFCRDCGQDFEIRGMSAGLFDLGSTGCLVIIAVSALIGLGMPYAIGNKYLVGVAVMASFVSLYMVLEWSISRIVLWRFPERAAQVATPDECPNCHHRNYASPGQLKDPIPCLKCGQRAVIFEVSGMS